MKLTKIGDFLKRSKIPIDILDNEDYSRVTIRINHNGVSLRDTEVGKKIGTKKQFILKAGQFIVSKIDARYGAFGIAPLEVDNAIITGNFWAYDVDFSKLNIEWFNQFTNSPDFYDLCERASAGITHRKYLNESFFLNYEILLPSVEQQLIQIDKIKLQKISFGKLTFELTRQLNIIKQMRQAFLREAMQGKLVKSTNTKETGQQLLAKIKAEKAQLIAEKKLKKEKELAPITEDEIPFEIPEHWAWCRLGEISNIQRGKSPKYSDNGVFKMLNQKCVRWFSINIEHSKAVDEIWFNSINKELKIKVNDLLVNSTGDGTIGRSGIADILCDNFMFDSHILRVRSFVKIEQKLLCYIINSEYGQSLIESIKGATSTKQTELGVNNLSNFPIPLPPLHEQEQILAKLEELMAFCDGLEQSIKESQGYNEMLLQQVLREALQGEKV